MQKGVHTVRDTFARVGRCAVALGRRAIFWIECVLNSDALDAIIIMLVIMFMGLLMLCGATILAKWGGKWIPF
jgi:hypothetical protein